MNTCSHLAAAEIFLKKLALPNMKSVDSAVFISEAKGPNQDLNTHVPQALSEMLGDARLSGKTIIRGAVTNGRSWILLILTSTRTEVLATSNLPSCKSPNANVSRQRSPKRQPPRSLRLSHIGEMGDIMQGEYKLGGSSSGFFSHAHHFVINNPTMIDASYDSRSMDSLARHTIPGAEFDSSARDPPPRCHPGTRLDLSALFKSWIRDVARQKNLAWLFGPAGVGKSAILQTLAEELSEAPEDFGDDIILGATLFFSKPFKRDDPQRVVLTITYQLAVKFPFYRKYVLGLLNKDPKVVEKSFMEQFKRFIVKPFAKRGTLAGFDRETVLVILDGLDECAGERAQREIVLAIGRFVLQYPGSPLAWIVSSRPEPHIRAVLDSRAISSSWIHVEVPVNSIQACSDVERYLRSEFESMREKYPFVFDLEEGEQWPPEVQFVKITRSSSGLFLFATIAIRFIDDVDFGNPVAQLKQVMDVIESTGQVQESTPFAALDALYAQILLQVPQTIYPTTKRILGCLTKPYPNISFSSFAELCNWLGLSQADAYGSLQKLHSVLDVPRPEEKERGLGAFHASFVDYLASSTRSGSFYLDPLEVKREQFQAGQRVLEDAHNMTASNVLVSRIRLSWPAKGEEDTHRLELFLTAFQILLLAEPEVLDGTYWSLSNRRASFFCDLSLEKIVSSSGDYVSQWLTLWPLLMSIHTSPSSSRSQEDKLFQYVPVSSLDPAFLDMDRMYIFRNGCAFDNLGHTEPLGDEEPQVLVLLRKFGPVVLPNDAWMVNPRNRDFEWGDYFLSHVAMTMKQFPSPKAILYGQDCKANVLMRLAFPDAEWLVFAAYVRL
ncbi:hypothetical protein NP233_g5377 [Leucocoprinus birnbaumii]|uniref:NACHT domain-containing protein n=1 Tax=Leucocoprinus birnbaumii TaxID=56174 RepID=A0AAD5YWT3_9AGAR|nr:hypothetical protein NP233_g5377 [Leucocoprinus birnbaumii]